MLSICDGLHWLALHCQWLELNIKGIGLYVYEFVKTEIDMFRPVEPKINAEKVEKHDGNFLI